MIKTQDNVKRNHFVFNPKQSPKELYKNLVNKKFRKIQRITPSQ